MLDASPGVELHLGVDFEEARARWKSQAPHLHRRDRRILRPPLRPPALPLAALRAESFTAGATAAPRAGFRQTRLLAARHAGELSGRGSPFTRIVEIKHATGQQIAATTIVREFPKDWTPGDEPFYPIPAPDARAAYQRYAGLAAAEPHTSFIGRLATYRYYNMDQVTGMALTEADKLISRYGSNLMKKLFIAGHRGMVGSALVREAAKLGGYQVITTTRDQLDLCDQTRRLRFPRRGKTGHRHHRRRQGRRHPRELDLSGGFHLREPRPSPRTSSKAAAAPACRACCSSARPASIRKWRRSRCRRTACSPRPLEPTNEAYAIAKIAGLKLCQHYRAQHGLIYHSAMPTNLYGPGDNYHPENSHVIPALIRRFHEAKERGDATVTIWGTGTPRREFLHVDDLATACFHLLALDNPPDWVNVGIGEDVTILELASLVAEDHRLHRRNPNRSHQARRHAAQAAGHLAKSKPPAGRPWSPFETGLAAAYQDFLSTLATGAARL